MKRDIRIVGKERQVLDIGKFVLALVALAEQRSRDGEPAQHEPATPEPAPVLPLVIDQTSLPRKGDKEVA